MYIFKKIRRFAVDRDLCPFPCKKIANELRYNLSRGLYLLQGANVTEE